MLNPATRKQVLRHFSYGVYIATTADRDAMAGATVTWVSQASFEPPLIMMAARADGKFYDLLTKTGKFALHVLRRDQRHIAAKFFRPASLIEGKLSDNDFTIGEQTGCPILTDAPAWLECVVTDTVVRGDHTIVVGEIVALQAREEEFDELGLRDTPWSYAK
ncbi:flavin reductase family protein [Candidatus Neomarinimicrobiota bacterium]